MATTAVSILLFTETSMPSGIFIKKMPPWAIFRCQHVNRNRSSAAASRQFHLEEITSLSSEQNVTEARELLLEYGRFVIAQPGATRFCFGTLENEAARLPFSFHEQGGGCFMARVDGQPAGFIAWRAVPESRIPNAWELKRLWVRPVGRGLGLGKALTQAVLDRAVAAGRTAIYLDTVPAAMSSAVRVYQDLGFEPCEAYNDNPMEELLYLKKSL